MLGYYHPRGSGEDHPKVRSAFGSIGRSDLKNKLLGLSMRRGKADYDLHVTVTYGDAQRALQIAKDLLAEISSLT